MSRSSCDAGRTRRSNITLPFTVLDVDSGKKTTSAPDRDDDVGSDSAMVSDDPGTFPKHGTVPQMRMFVGRYQGD